MAVLEGCPSYEISGFNVLKMGYGTRKYHPQVNFTFEQMVNNKMSFLDCLFVREGKNLEVKFYKKKTAHKGQYIHYTNSLLQCSTKHKGIITSLSCYFGPPFPTGRVL